MLGLSRKVKRTELLHMKHTGIAKEYSDWLQKNVLDKGHEVEALSRPIVERMIDDDLYPVTCSEGKLSASCDGLTMSYAIAFEHKQWNAEYAEMVRNGILPEEHAPQCYQILLVTGAEKVIFVISDGTEENMVSMEVYPDQEWFDRIRAGWAQFEKDLAEYVPVEIKEMPKAEVTIDLPALFVHAKGEITEHNMAAYGSALSVRLAEVRAIALVTDQDFSNAKAAAAYLRNQAKAVKAEKAKMLEQTVTIGEAVRMMDAWEKDLNATALQLEKDVEREDKAKKETMVLKAAAEFRAHVDALESETSTIKISVTQPDFAAAIKGKRSYASMQDAVDTALANGKVAADAIAKDIRGKLVWLSAMDDAHDFLFSDIQQIINMPLAAFQAIVEKRIVAHRQAEIEKMEAERARIETEAKAKAEREAAEKLAAEETRIRAEERAKAQEEAKSGEKESQAPSLGDVLHASVPAPVAQAIAPRRPTRTQMIEVIASHFAISILTADEWLRAEFEEVVVAA